MSYRSVSLIIVERAIRQDTFCIDDDTHKKGIVYDASLVQEVAITSNLLEKDLPPAVSHTDMSGNVQVFESAGCFSPLLLRSIPTDCGAFQVVLFRDYVRSLENVSHDDKGYLYSSRQFDAVMSYKVG